MTHYYLHTRNPHKKFQWKQSRWLANACQFLLSSLPTGADLKQFYFRFLSFQNLALHHTHWQHICLLWSFEFPPVPLLTSITSLGTLISPVESQHTSCWPPPFGTLSGEWHQVNQTISKTHELLNPRDFKISIKVRTGTSVGNSHRSAGPRPATLEEDRELFVDFSLISCLWFEIQGRRTYNFFDLSFKHWLELSGPNSFWKMGVLWKIMVLNRLGN